MPSLPAQKVAPYNFLAVYWVKVIIERTNLDRSLRINGKHISGLLGLHNVT